MILFLFEVYSIQQITPSVIIKDSNKSELSNSEKNSKDEKVIVKGKRNKNRSDRIVYDAKSDPENSTLSIGDVLNKAPGISVDPEGNLSLRGDKNVKLLINGRETLSTNPENRAMFLLSSGGQSIDSIEIMTNPSAQFSSDGAAGVINIVTKKDAALGVTLTARTRIDSEGGGSINFNISENKGKTDKAISIEVRKSLTDSDLYLNRKINTNKGVFTGYLSSDGQSLGTSNVTNLTSNFGYKISNKDIINIELSYKLRNTDLNNTTNGSNQNNSNEILNEFVRNSTNSVSVKDQALDLSWNRNYNNGDKFVLSLNYGNYSENISGNNNSKYSYAFGQTSFFNDLIDRKNKSDKTSVKLDYSTQLIGNSANFGFESIRENGERSTLYYTSILGNYQRNDRLSNMFIYHNTTDAIYSTFSFPILDRITTQIGIRYEKWGNKIPIYTKSQTIKPTDCNLYGSMHISYFFDDNGVLRASYSTRTQRPEIKDLNPFLIYRDKENWSSGNPNLISATGDIFEIGYDKSSKGNDFSIKIYRKAFDKLVSTAYEWLDDEVLLSTKSNNGKIITNGVDFDFSGPIGKSLRANINIGYGVSKVSSSDFNNQGYVGIYNGKIGLTYRITSNDNLTLFLSTSGKQISVDEIKVSGLLSSLSYNHKINNNFSATFSYQNLLNDNDYKSLRKSALSEDRFDWKNNVSYLSISVSYKLQSNKI